LRKARTDSLGHGISRSSILSVFKGVAALSGSQNRRAKTAKTLKNKTK
jgi:hypothetical protein